MSEATVLLIEVVRLALGGVITLSAALRISQGIAAKAEAEGREVTTAEQEVINGLLEAAKQRARGRK